MRKRILIVTAFMLIPVSVAFAYLLSEWTAHFTGEVGKPTQPTIMLCLPDGTPINTFDIGVIGYDGIAIYDFKVKSTYTQPTNVIWNYDCTASTVTVFFKFWNESVTPSGGWSWWGPREILQFRAGEIRDVQMVVFTNETPAGTQFTFTVTFRQEW
ncbi:MAG: hypothetical protein QXZ25_00235 [Candidatus Bathyarchaeia archaeon]